MSLFSSHYAFLPKNNSTLHSLVKKAWAGEDSLITLFKRKDWMSYVNYMHPSIIEMVGEKENFVTTLQQSMNTLEVAKLDAFKNGRVLQTIKANGQYLCVIKLFMQMTLNDMLISGRSYDVTFSTDGNDWEFLSSYGVRVSGNN